MGGRLLRQRLLRPSMNRAEIEQRLDAVGEVAAADHPARGIAQAARRHSGSGAAAGEGDARVGGSAGCAGAGAVAGEDPGAEALLRHAAGGAAARRCTTGWTSLPDVANLILDSDRRRAAAQPGRRRHDPRRLSCGARRTARLEPERQAVHRADRSARAAAHGHRSR